MESSIKRFDMQGGYDTPTYYPSMDGFSQPYPYAPQGYYPHDFSPQHTSYVPTDPPTQHYEVISMLQQLLDGQNHYNQMLNNNFDALMSTPTTSWPTGQSVIHPTKVCHDIFDNGEFGQQEEDSQDFDHDEEINECYQFLYSANNEYSEVTQTSQLPESQDLYHVQEGDEIYQLLYGADAEYSEATQISQLQENAPTQNKVTSEFEEATHDQDRSPLHARSFHETSGEFEDKGEESMDADHVKAVDEIYRLLYGQDVECSAATKVSTLAVEDHTQKKMKSGKKESLNDQARPLDKVARSPLADRPFQGIKPASDPKPRILPPYKPPLPFPSRFLTNTPKQVISTFRSDMEVTGVGLHNIGTMKEDHLQMKLIGDVLANKEKLDDDLMDSGASVTMILLDMISPNEVLLVDPVKKPFEEIRMKEFRGWFYDEYDPGDSVTETPLP